MTDALYSHQDAMAQFFVDNNIVCNTSDPGTGKTRGTLEGLTRKPDALPALIVAPLSILRASWGDDIEKFTELSWSVAHGSEKKRRAAFEAGSDIVLINHDGIKWLSKNMDLLEGFKTLVIDEFTAYKNRTAQRSRAAGKVAGHFDQKIILSGTPNPNTILDLWFPVLLLDGGLRLGSRYFQFRNQVCSPEPIGFSDHVKWVDKPGAQEAVGDAISDISIRYKFEDCVDIPPNQITTRLVDLPATIMRKYLELQENSVLYDKQGKVAMDAIHASARVKKMLQLLSGAVYDNNGNPVQIHTERYDLVMSLVEERAHTLVAFNWKHERQALEKIAKSKGISYAFIDGSVNADLRAEIVRDFQAGKYQVLFCHPQAAGHGLTLTKATTVIWCTPTYSAEQFQQFNRRIYRAGQQLATETICIAARDTKEIDVYTKLNEKLVRTEELLGVLAA